MLAVRTEGIVYSLLNIAKARVLQAWDGDRFTFVDNITSAILPTNNDTLTIGYNHRFMITDPRRTIPLVWTVSKIEDSTPIGITELKFTQETYNPILDNKELMLCKFYDSEITPKPSSVDDIVTSTATITYNGTKPTVKVGGSWKIFTPTFGDQTVTVSKWTISDKNGDISGNTNYTIERDGDLLKLKIALNYNLIGTVLTVEVEGSDGSQAELSVEVV